MDRFEKRDVVTLQQACATREEKLTGALIATSKSLKAAISLLESIPQAKKAAPSDKMFNRMIADYKKALERGIAALSRS